MSNFHRFKGSLKPEEVHELMAGVGDVDTTKFLLNHTARQCLLNLQYKTMAEKVNTTPQECAESDVDYIEVQSKLSYEIQFIRYLVDLSDANQKLLNENHNPQ